MKLSNFKIAEDNIAFEKGDQYYDLHNNFDFIGFSYEVSTRTIELNWSKNKGDWVPNDSPDKIKLVLEDVNFLKAKERDSEIPFAEDDCLSSIGFMWNNMIEEMGAFNSSEPKEECTHLSIEFMSGFALKISAGIAILKVR